MNPETCSNVQDMTKLSESAGRVVRQKDGTFRICVINEGQGSSADWPRDFFEGERGRANADVLSGVISFPNHPRDFDRPEDRDPMTAIGRIGRQVDIEEHDGKLGFWADYIPSKRAGVAEHLEEFGDKLGVSVFCEGETRTNIATGREEAVALDPTDPYCSVDVVVVAGRGGKFAKQLAESHRRFAEEASAPAGEENEETQMDKEAFEAGIAELKNAFTSAIQALADKLDGKAQADAQVEVDEKAVEAAVESKLDEYDKAVEAITEAKLTESQSSELRARARKGEDITGAIETAKKVLAEARKGSADGGEERHIGGGSNNSALSFDVPGFGRIVS